MKSTETPDLIVTSTTDDQAEVERVVGLKPPEAGGEENFGEVVKDEAKPADEKGKEVAAEKPGDGEKPPVIAAGAGKGQKRWQQRVDKLTGTVYQLKDDLARERSQREELERRLSAANGNGRSVAESTAVVDRAKKPEQKDFKTYEEFNAALTEFNTRESLARVRAEEEQAVSQERLREMISNYNTRLAEFKQEHDDFDEVVGQEDIKIPEAVQLAVLELENGPDVAYYLGQHPELCEQLAGMTAVRSVAEIGRLSVALEKAGGEKPPSAAKPNESSNGKQPEGKEPDGAKPAAAAPPAKKPVTAAPAPIEPVSGNAPPETVPLDELPYDQYARTRRKQLAN